MVSKNLHRNMKLITKDEADAQYHATTNGGIRGLVGGVGLAIPGSYLLQRRWPYYRSLPPSLKAFGAVMLIVPAVVISAEHAGLKYEREHWTGPGAAAIDAKRSAEVEHWQSLTLPQKAQDWATRHQWGIVIGGWATALATSFGLVSRNPYQTAPQKIVQARLWAQGLTLGLLLTSGYIAHTRRMREEGPITSKADYEHKRGDHSWQYFIEGDKART